MFEDFFESSSPADYAKMLINIKNADENKKNVAEIKDRISDLKGRIKEMIETEKKQMLTDIRDYQRNSYCNKNAQKTFQLASKVDKEKSKPNLKKAFEKG